MLESYCFSWLNRKHGVRLFKGKKSVIDLEEREGETTRFPPCWPQWRENCSGLRGSGNNEQHEVRGEETRVAIVTDWYDVQV